MPVSRTAVTVRPVLVVTALIVSMTTWWEISGRPRQFMVIAENSRCSILFHLLVPGGRCATVMSRPASAANAASPVFRSRSREPSDPPESAVISRRRAPGLVARPSPGHQDRIEATANAPVSWSVPTLTPAGVRGQVADPAGHRLARLLVSEVVHADPLGLPRRRPFRAAVLEVPDILLLLGVHADHRAAVVLERCDPGVDVPELRVTVGVLFPLDRLGVALQAVPGPGQQPGHGPRCHRVALPG